MPVELLLTADDRATKLVKLPVEIWYGGDRYRLPRAARQARRERSRQSRRRLSGHRPVERFLAGTGHRHALTAPSPSPGNVMRLRVLLLLLGLQPLSLVAQQPASVPGSLLPSEPGDSSPFRRLPLPEPSAVRSADGAPGQGYWQQRADYVIRATLDTATRTLRGEETITYTNNSPDTLRFVWLQLDQNLFSETSRGNALFGAPPASSPAARAPGATSAAVPAGIRLLKVAQPASGTTRGKASSPAAELKYLVNGTVMRVDLAQPPRAQGKAAARARLVFPVSRQPQPDGGRRRRRESDLRGSAVVSTSRGVRRRPRMEYRAVLRTGRVLSRVRQLRRQDHRARRHARRGYGHAAQSRRSPHGGPARPSGSCPHRG